MIIIKFQGGLGNQLFEYALYRRLELLGKDVYADLSNYEMNRDDRNYELSMLGLKVKKANKLQLLIMGNQGSKLAFHKNRLFGDTKYMYYEKEAYVYDSNVFSIDSAYLAGYWQNENYFKMIRADLLSEIQFSINKTEKVKRIEKMISESNSASIHMRFGDYLLNDDIYGGICTPSYYTSAIDYLRQRKTEVKFFVFSDNIEMANDVMNKIDCHGDYYIVDTSDICNTQLDMYLMSICKNNIIANSSYSWWAAWLNRNSDKIVVKPQYWINRLCNEYMHVPEWVIVDSCGYVLEK